MDIGRMRVEVTNTYPGKKWREKVRKMSDRQVIALFYRFLNDPKQYKLDLKTILPDTPIQVTFDQVYSVCNASVKPQVEVNCITIPYVDQMMCGYMVCSKESLLAGWTQLIGQYADIDKRMRRVKGVKVDGELLFITLD